MTKKLIVTILCAIMLVGMVIPANAAEKRDTSFETLLARDLKELNLFKGVSDTNFDLNREPTRIEALVMLLRVLGVEEDVFAASWKHPFRDVPKWADAYIGYAYENGLTNGISKTQFGTGTANAAMYLTFMLRALGYSDANEIDFSWNNPYDLAYNVGILPLCVDCESFLRADAVSVSYAALSAEMKNSEQTLASWLMQCGVFDQTSFFHNYDAEMFQYWVDYIAIKTVHYEWDWYDWSWSYDLLIPAEAVRIYKSIERNPYSYYYGYSSYVFEPNDDEYLHALANVFENTVRNEGLGKDDAVYLAISFVQSLDYLPDDDNLGYDYPKYPLETLYDKGGDCEDTSILLASLLREMGYGCCLIMFDDHMGVGVLGDDTVYGRYFELDGDKFFYVETTGEGWQVGDMPTEYLYKKATLWRC